MSTKVNIEMNVDTKKSEGKIKNVNKALDSTAKGANKAKNSTSGLGNSLNAATGGVAAKIKGIIIALRGAMLATIGWGTALKAVGIGLIITAIFGLKAAFTSSEEGQNKFAKIMSAIGVTTGNLIDVVAEYGNVIMSLYKAVTQLFSAGGWRKSIDTAKTALKGLGAAVDDLVNNTGKEIALAEQVADRLADATKKERQLVVDRAKANRDRADLLQKSVDKEKYNLQERLEFLKKAGEIEETITDKEVELAKVRFDAKVLQNTFSKSTIADLDEEASLKAKVIELETSKLTKAKLVNSQISSLRKQERAEIKAIKDQESADQKVLDDKKSADQKVLDDAAEAEKLRKKIAIQQIEKNFRIKNENAEINTKLEKIELEKERKLIELDELDAHEDQKKEVILYYDNLISKTKEENEKKDLELKELTAKQKLKITADMFGAVGDLIGKDTEAGKAAAMAQAVINTYLGVTEALKQHSSLPSPFDVIAKIGNVATVLATGLSAVKSIQSVKVGSAGASISMGGSRGSTAAPSPPSFNVVGNSNESQLAESILSQQQVPIKTYVVSSDVSTAESLERNIVESATI